jgi:hypothetical protein
VLASVVIISLHSRQAPRPAAPVPFSYLPAKLAGDFRPGQSRLFPAIHPFCFQFIAKCPLNNSFVLTTFHFHGGCIPPQRGNHELNSVEFQPHRGYPGSYSQERLFTSSIARGPLPASFRQRQTLPQFRFPFPLWSLPSSFHRECRHGRLATVIPK